MKSKWKLFVFDFVLLTRIYKNVLFKSKKSDLFSFINLYLFSFCLNFIFRIYCGNSFIEIKVVDKMLNSKIKNYLKLKKDKK